MIFAQSRQRWVLPLILLALSLLFIPSARAQTQSGETVPYTMQPGDTLIGLARQYFTSPDDYRRVQRLNRIRNDRGIPVGFVLKIPRDLLRSRPANLTVASFSGPVEIVRGGRTSAPAIGAEVPEGTELRTGARGFLALQGSNGALVSLPSQSRVQVTRARYYLINDALDVLFEIVGGRGEFAPPSLRESDEFKVRTPVAVSAVRGTVFRIFYNDSGNLGGAEVLEGTVALSAGSAMTGALDVPAGFGAIASPKGIGEPEALLPSPELVDPGKIQTEERLSFTFAPVAGATAYRMQVARDAGFVETIGEVFSESPAASFESLPNGTYFVRARAVATSGIEGFADAYSFRRQRLGVSATAEPSPIPGGYRFAWRKSGEGPARFNFELWREGSRALPLVNELATEQTGITVTDLEPGTYFWRVAALQPGPDEMLVVWGPEQRLLVAP